MTRNLIYVALFLAGWVFSTFVPPPKFLRRKVDSWLQSGSSYLDKKEDGIKKNLRQEIQEGAEKINKKLK